VYGVEPADGSNLHSLDLLRRIKYPDRTTGEPSGDPTDQEAFTYNALGQQASKTDQNDSVHAFGFDVLGRPTGDAIGTLGTGVDGAVRRLGLTYDTLGRPENLTSFDAATGGTAVNQVRRLYNGLSQLINELPREPRKAGQRGLRQAHGGAVSGSTPAFGMLSSEMSGGANHSRLAA